MYKRLAIFVHEFGSGIPDSVQQNKGKEEQERGLWIESHKEVSDER